MPKISFKGHMKEEKNTINNSRHRNIIKICLKSVKYFFKKKTSKNSNKSKNLIKLV